MPGTDGPGQFPAHKHVVIPLVRAGPGHLYTGPKAECEISGVQIIGGTFFLLPHTPTHTVSESPNVP